MIVIVIRSCCWSVLLLVVLACSWLLFVFSVPGIAIVIVTVSCYVLLLLPVVIVRVLCAL